MRAQRKISKSRCENDGAATYLMGFNSEWKKLVWEQLITFSGAPLAGWNDLVATKREGTSNIT